MRKFEELWVIVQEVWEQGLWGIDIGRFGVALGIFLGFLLFRKLFTRFVIARVKKLTENTETDVDDAIVTALEKPLRFVPVVVGLFFAFDHLALEGAPAEIAARIIRSLIAFNIFWVFHNTIDPLSAFVRVLERIVTSAMVDWLVKAVKILVIFLGAATILELWGIEVAPLIAGLGLFGVAVALGAQDLFKNLISGILVLAERRFHVGDWIKVDGVVEGTVESIGFRSTLVRRFDQAPVYVPNSKLSDNATTNFSAMTHRRIYWVVGLEYRTTVEQLRRIRDGIERYIVDTGKFVDPPRASRFIRVDSFSDSSIDLLIYCFTKTRNWGEWLEIKEELTYAIKTIVEEAGSGFAFPSRSIYIETPPEERPLAFRPSEAAPGGETVD